MNRRARFTTALSTLAIAAVISGCATGPQSRESIFGSKVDHENIGLATRAQAALVEGQLTTAVELAERAVENTPNDAGFRGLLGNIYFASGRFASAEEAYRDSLSLIPRQPELILKLALVQIAQGKNSEALSVLAAARNMLDPANFGLALALAGRPDDAVAILNQVARAPAADARVRQNLALAYGLSGDWTMARTLAAQDVPPDQLDSRIQKWMVMATPTRPSDQVAALTGIKPAADPGQPERLALNRTPRASEAHAQLVVPKVAPQPQRFAPIPAAPEPQPQQFAPVPVAPPPALPEPMPAPPAVNVAAAPAVIDSAPAASPIVNVAEAPVVVDSAAPPAPAVEADPVIAKAVQSLIEPVPSVEAPAAVEAPLVPAVAEPVPESSTKFEVPVVVAVTKPVPELPTKFEAAVQPASYVAISDAVRRAAKKARKARGKSKSVVQLGAYSSPERVSVAWNRITKQYPALSDYTPMRARFDGRKGTVWRLSIKGFASQQEAIDRCEQLQNRGGSCFVRRVAGDSPVQFASR